MELQIVKHQFNTTMANGNMDNTLLGAFGALLDLSHALVRIMNANEDDIDEFDEPILFDNYALDEYANKALATLPPVNASMMFYKDDYKKITDLLRTILLADYSSEVMNEIKELKAVSKKLLSNLVNALYYDFIHWCGAGAVDEVVVKYAKSKAIQLPDLLSEIYNLYVTYRVSLGFFIDHPDYEQPFYDALGPFVIYVHEDDLTMDFVRQILNGELTGEDLQEMAEDPDDEEDLSPSNSFKVSE